MLLQDNLGNHTK